MPDLQASPVLLLPQLSLADEMDSTLPLEFTSVIVQVTGPVASVVVEQRFGNPLKETAELDYLFPLPADAAITAFELMVGTRRITGDLQEREAARASYEDALQQGKRAGLFEQRRPNLFAVRLANVRAGETIQAAVHYQQRLKFEDGLVDGASAYEFVFPMGLTPKYDASGHPSEGEGVHAPIAFGGEPIGPIEISLAADAGIAVHEPVSPSHPIEITRLDERRFQVQLAGQHIPDHDFVLRYAPAAKHASAASWVSDGTENTFFLATVIPPAIEEEVQPSPREFIFVLDRSGSMSGEPIQQARNALRACLRALNPADTFRILLFDNELAWFQAEPSTANDVEVGKADAFLTKVQGRGGTEILRALDAVLDLPAQPERMRFVVFLTDGAVSAESRVLENIRRKVAQTRLFTFGIDSSVNRALLSRMAELGRGRATFLQLNEDIEGAIIRFQDSVSFPALTDLTLEWSGAKAWDVYPSRLPDLYFGQPLEICGRLSRGKKGPLQLTVHGKRAGQPVELHLTLPEASTPDPVIERVWARARVDDLTEQMELEPRQADALRAQILGLALEHNLVTAFTSFVAVDHSSESAGGKPRIIHVAQPLPQGVQPSAFMPPPQNFMLASMAAPMPRMRSMKAVADSIESADLDLPAFMRRRDSAGGHQAQPELVRGMASPAGEEQSERDTLLRWLGRNQKMDGSWNGSVEFTAAALLAFVRAGQTTRAGSYRQPLRRAARWLVEHMGQGVDMFLRARALEELATATNDEVYRSAAQAARLVLPGAADVMEQAALGQTVSAPAAIRTLDDLRLAALLRVNLPVPPEMLKGKDAELVSAWMAAL